MKAIESALRTFFSALLRAASALRGELARLNNVAEINSDCREGRAARAGKVKEWMRRRAGNSARCC